MVSYLPEPTEGGNFTPPPAGTHPAICYRFIDLGTQQSKFNNETKTARKVMLSWEITDPELRTDDGHPFTISQRYTWSMHEKATLRKTLEAWRGTAFIKTDFGKDGFSVKKLIGVGCLLSILHEPKEGGGVYANIGAVMKLPRGMDAGMLFNPTAFLSLDEEDFDREVFNGLSDKLQETIKGSPEYGFLSRPHEPADFVPPNFQKGDPGFNDSDIPF
jgi:hypothetical protein